jgi:DNA-binding GntR family transcriptional regulator
VPADPKLAVVEAVRAAIVQGEYAPNQRLIETDLCERFATSRFIARAALQELAARGLVEFQPNKGARVRNISLEEAIEITEIRMLLEGHAAGRAAERVSAAEAADLRGIVADMHQAVSRSDLLRYIDLNAKLHGAIRDISGHSTSARLLAQLRDQTVRHQFILSLGPGRPSVSLPQHEAIVLAITAHDAAAAEREMREHLQSVISELRALLATPSAANGAQRPVAAPVTMTAPSGVERSVDEVQRPGDVGGLVRQ